MYERRSKMSIFDKLKNSADSEKGEIPSKQIFTFGSLPESLDEMKSLPESSLESPYATAALCVCALCAYAADHEIGCEMLNFLRGGRALTNHDISFINDRFRDGHHVPFSYFAGATPANGYTPDVPFKVTVNSGPYSDFNEGYKKLYIRSGGADNPREVVLRREGGKWYLHEQFLLVSVKTVN